MTPQSNRLGILGSGAAINASWEECDANLGTLHNQHHYYDIHISTV